MNIDDFLVSDKPHERQVTMADGSQHTLHFLEPTAADVRRLIDAELSKDRERYNHASQELVAACLYDPKLKRRVFEGEDYPKRLKLNFNSCERMGKAILAIAGVNLEKKSLSAEQIFRHKLALALGKCVYELDKIPYKEYENWRKFYLIYPFDDAHRYYRPAALLASMQATQPQRALKAALEFLQPDPRLANLNEIDRSALEAFGLN